MVWVKFSTELLGSQGQMLTTLGRSRMVCGFMEDHFQVYARFVHGAHMFWDRFLWARLSLGGEVGWCLLCVMEVWRYEFGGLSAWASSELSDHAFAVSAPAAAATAPKDKPAPTGPPYKPPLPTTLVTAPRNLAETAISTSPRVVLLRGEL